MAFEFPAVSVPSISVPIQYRSYFGLSRCTTLTPGAAEANRQIALAFVDVVGQQVHQQFGDALYEFFGLRKRANVFGHARRPSGERPELGHKMWIGQEGDV